VAAPIASKRSPRADAAVETSGRRTVAGLAHQIPRPALALVRRAAAGELTLPALQPGSSIIAAKVNP